MTTARPGARTPYRPAGRKPGRALLTAAVAHTAATLALAAAGVWGARSFQGGYRATPAIGRDPSGALELGGAPDRPVGTVDTNYQRWELRGVAGPIGVLFSGRTVRTEAEPLDRAQLLRAARRLAESNPEPQGLMARAWASEGPFLLFEPAPGWPLAAGATLAAAAAGWTMVYLAGRRTAAGWARRRRASAERGGRCARCGFDRAGLPPAAPCPECGEGAAARTA